jgi:ferredoxin
MIGEGTQSTNQRRHNYVQENIEVGFFTDPTVCIGCKACEVACKEWNEVPEDGFRQRRWRRPIPLGFPIRCLQALRGGGLPRSVSDWLHRAN